MRKPEHPNQAQSRRRRKSQPNARLTASVGASHQTRRSLSFFNRQRARSVDLRLLKRITNYFLTETLEVSSFDLSICLLADAEMTRLNQDFVHHTGTTDVITFDYAEKEVPESRRPSRSARLRCTTADRRDAGPTLHGEIFLCMDEALRQARRFRTTWQSELARYLIHGVLHLLGYDDRRPAARRRMKRAESRLLRDVAVRFTLSRLDAAPRLRA